MDARSLDLPPNLLARFVTLCDLGNLPQAADALDCTPQALSRSISELEHAAGRQLLITERDARTLTPVGERVAAAARGALTAISRFQAAAYDDRSTLRAAHVANADTLSIVLDQLPLHSRMRVGEHVVPDHQQLGQLRAHRLDVAVCTTTDVLPDDLAASPLRRDPLVAFRPPDDSATSEPAIEAAVAPYYGHAWRAHDDLVDAYARAAACRVERIPVPVGSGRELGALVRAARGRHILVAASAAHSCQYLPGVVSEQLCLRWRLVWRRDDRHPSVHEFLTAAQDVAHGHGWLDPVGAPSDRPFARPGGLGE